MLYMKPMRKGIKYGPITDQQEKDAIRQIVNAAVEKHGRAYLAEITEKSTRDILKYGSSNEKVRTLPTVPTFMRILATLATFRKDKACLPAWVFKIFK